MKSKKLYAIIHDRISALVEVAEAQLRVDLWTHLARLETEHDILRATLAWALGDEIFAVARAAGQTMPLEQILAEVVATRSCYARHTVRWIGDERGYRCVKRGTR